MSQPISSWWWGRWINKLKLICLGFIYDLRILHVLSVTICPTRLNQKISKMAVMIWFCIRGDFIQPPYLINVGPLESKIPEQNLLQYDKKDNFINLWFLKSWVLYDEIDHLLQQFYYTRAGGWTIEISWVGNMISYMHVIVIINTNVIVIITILDTASYIQQNIHTANTASAKLKMFFFKSEGFSIIRVGPSVHMFRHMHRQL